MPCGVIIFVRAAPSDRFVHSEKQTGRLIGHVLGPMVCEEERELGSSTTDLLHSGATQEHAVRDAVQSRAYHQTLRPVEQKRTDKMAIFLNFLGGGMCNN